MDNPNCNTTHRKGQHLTSEERHEIEVRLKDGWTIYKIAKHLSRPYNTIKNEVEHFKTDGWSLDACAGSAIETGKFPRS